MTNKFQFKILSGTNPQEQYSGILTKDPYTFYLLKNGVGYLGETKLFDGTSQETNNLVTNMLTEEYAGDDLTTASTKAIVDYVKNKVSNVSGVLTTAFFRKVEVHTIREQDLSNPNISCPHGTEENEVGLLFTSDTNETDDGTEKKYFVSLKGFLKTIYSGENTKSININIDPENKIKADFKIKSTEKSLKIDNESGGVYLEKTTEINKETPSEEKIVTEKSLVDFIKKLKFIEYEVDDGTNSI